MTIQDLFDLNQRVALITGGAGLLGGTFAHTLAEAGAKIVIADINAPVAQAIAENLHQSGHAAIAVQTDVREPESVQGMVAAALDEFGRLDILVNSAALDPKFDPQHEDMLTQTFETYPLETWNESLAVDLTGAFLCAQAAVRPMLKQGQGVMINICSIYGLVGPDQTIYQPVAGKPTYKPVAYSVTKSGILGLTRYLATYYAGKNIRVNALTPGGVFDKHTADFVAAYSARTVLGRMARKDDLSGALLFLASDASAYMTGANLVVDGGWTAW